MQIDKQQILNYLRDNGDGQKAQQAEEELPATVDTNNEHDTSILQKLGIDPMDLAKKFMGGGGISGL